jgi:hypothetical protein
MKHTSILLLLLLLSSCVSIQKYDVDIRVLKYRVFGKIKYIPYDSISINGGYVQIVRRVNFETQTNYVYGEFELLDYNQYLKDKM